MLKIKDDINLKELEKFGFKPKYDEDTGELKAYLKISNDAEYIGLFVTLKNEKNIRVFKFKANEWRINPYRDHFDIDTLYDLIQAGLVEKVKE